MHADYPLAVPQPEPPRTLAAAGQAANDAAARRAAHTLRRQAADLALFHEYLASVGLPTGELQADPAAWRGLTWGLVAGFARWMLGTGYAVGSINIRLSTVKTHAKLAFQAGTINPAQHALIRTVSGYTHKEGQQVTRSARPRMCPSAEGARRLKWCASPTTSRGG